MSKKDQSKTIVIMNTVLRDKDLTHLDKLLTGYLRAYARKNGKIYITAKQLAKKTNKSIRAIRKSLNILTEKGYVKTNKTKNKNEYILNNMIRAIEKNKFIYATAYEIKQLTDGAGLLICLLNSFKVQYGKNIFISNKFISETINISERQVIRLLKELKDKDFIETLYTNKNSYKVRHIMFKYDKETIGYAIDNDFSLKETIEDEKNVKEFFKEQNEKTDEVITDDEILKPLSAEDNEQHNYELYKVFYELVNKYHFDDLNNLAIVSETYNLIDLYYLLQTYNINDFIATDEKKVKEWDKKPLEYKKELIESAEFLSYEEEVNIIACQFEKDTGLKHEIINNNGTLYIRETS